MIVATKWSISSLYSVSRPSLMHPTIAVIRGGTYCLIPFQSVQLPPHLTYWTLGFDESLFWPNPDSKVCIYCNRGFQVFRTINSPDVSLVTVTREREGKKEQTLKHHLKSALLQGWTMLLLPPLQQCLWGKKTHQKSQGNRTGITFLLIYIKIATLKV